jgi:predicted DNA-binding protein
MSHAISLRLPDELFNEFNKLCITPDRPNSYIIKKALQKYIAENADYELALKRLCDKDDKIISLKKIIDKLGLYNRI